MMTARHRIDDETWVGVIKMMTGRHRIHDVLALFSTFHVIELMTSLIYHIVVVP
jgi:hypothetical protein